MSQDLHQRTGVMKNGKALYLKDQLLSLQEERS
jgi:hypothetical protein